MSTVLQNNVNYINNQPASINPNLSYDFIFFQFQYKSNDLFEKEGKLILSFSFSFKNATIEIYDLENNLLNKVVNYQNAVYIWNTELNDFYVKVTTETSKVIDRIIYLKNCLNLKSSDLQFYPFLYNNQEINDTILAYCAKANHKINIKYMVDFKGCCKNYDENCSDYELTLYFYDNSKINIQESYLKTSWFTWSNFQIKEVIKDKFNKFIHGNENMKFGSQYKCAFSQYNKKYNRCELVLSPLEHYRFIDNILKLISHINTDYQYNDTVYKFLFKNPYSKINDLIVELSTI